MSTSLSRTRPGRVPLTGVAWLYMLLAIPVVALFCLEVTFIPLTIITVGLVALLAIVPMVAGAATVHRRLAEYVLGEPVPTPYRPVPSGGLLVRMKAWMRDPARWRDLAWMFVAITFGWTIAIIAAALILYVVWFFFFPVLWAMTPRGIFDEEFGFMTVDTQAKTFINWAFAVVAFGLWWYITPALVRLHAWVDREMLSNRTQRLEQRVAMLAESRADTVDFSAAELRRIERDLHDGAQARLVSLGMSLGMADEIIERDPEAARRLLGEARTTTSAALGDLRSVVRGMHPPVLADRGLAGAVQALALDMAIPVLVSVDLPTRPAPPVESAAYFAVAESLANVAKHSSASRAWVDIRHRDGLLLIEIGDDGNGGASPDLGTGLVGWPDDWQHSTAQWPCPAQAAGRRLSAWRCHACCHRGGPRPPPGRVDEAARGARVRRHRRSRQRAHVEPRVE
jgi:signal transduction histidine kinase